MKYTMLLLALLSIQLGLLALNVWWALTYGNPISWAACVFIAPLAVFNLAMLIRTATR